jgi:hypothetical protein
MQFVANGPHVPDQLVHSHEDGQVVFFCGAGASVPAGLPLFGKLTEQLYDRHAGVRDEAERDALKEKRFDVALSLLERRVGREPLRRSVFDLLQPRDRGARTYETHRALLDLARCRDGKHRLVTTNFDRLFHAALGDAADTITAYSAPLLPVPKRRLDGIVFLHGLLPASPSPQLNELVLSSGDFGIAYLVERWASRFVCELLKTYTVCFVGYSLDDPVMRYILDALAADRLRGEAVREVFAFAPYKLGEEQKTRSDWGARNVTPIPFDDSGDFVALHRTLREWASVYRDGISGKLRVVQQYAGLPPMSSTPDDDYVGRVLWALSDPSGAPARAFAKHDPTPPLGWLDYLLEARFAREDLARFEAAPLAFLEERTRFSLANRPCMASRTPWMSLFEQPRFPRESDPILDGLSDWLANHVASPELVLRLGTVRRGLARPLASRIRGALGRVRTNRAIAMLWNVVLASWTEEHPLDLFEWLLGFKLDGLVTPCSRRSLLAALAPRVALRRPVSGSLGTDEPGNANTRVSELASWDLELATPHARHLIDEAASIPDWPRMQVYALAGLTDLLRDALELGSALREQSEPNDDSFITRPSIADHPQNQHYEDWTILIDLVRDAWLAAANSAPDLARVELDRWRTIPFPLFRRLVFFAATQGSYVSTVQAARWLIEASGKWFWAMECKREAVRLMVHVSASGDADAWSIIEPALLAGPPARESVADQDAANYLSIHAQWLRLAKCRRAGAPLGPEAIRRLAEIEQANPGFELAEDESDEFAFWSRIGDPGLEAEKVAIPRRYRDLLEWLKARPAPDRWREEPWAEFARRDVRRASIALVRLARAGQWLPHRWSEALQAWSDESSRVRSWKWIRGGLVGLSDVQVAEIAHPLGFWLDAVASQDFAERERVEEIAARILSVCEYGLCTSPVTDLTGAINHPLGLATQAVFAAWLRAKPRNNDRLPPETARFLEAAAGCCECSAAQPIIASRIVALFYVDEGWARRVAVPLFDWRRGSGANLAWAGFLWTPRFLPSLMETLWPHLLEAPAHFDDLGKWRRPLAQFIGYVGLEQRSQFPIEEVRRITGALPPAGLAHIASWIPSMLESAGERREEYFRNRVLPYFREVWPQDLRLKNETISAGVVRICLAAGGAFPAAVESLVGWLVPSMDVDLVVMELVQRGLASSHPAPSLRLLDAVVRGDVERLYGDFLGCLTAIRIAEPSLAVRPEFRRLEEVAARLGLDSAQGAR